MSRFNTFAVALLAAAAFVSGCTGTAAKSSTSTPTTPAGGQLTASSSSVSFGQTAVGGNSTQTVTLSSTGSASVTISSVQVSGTGFTVVQPQLPATLAAGQSMVIGLEFSPQSAGQQSGSLNITSNASVPQITITLAGTGSDTPAGHSATLNWNNGDPTAISYNVYRSTVSGGPYLPLNSAPLSATTFKDSTVAAGSTYYYVVTETNASGVESQFSSEVPATVPAS
jgi:hypothetical protein